MRAACSKTPRASIARRCTLPRSVAGGRDDLLVGGEPVDLANRFGSGFLLGGNVRQRGARLDLGELRQAVLERGEFLAVDLRLRNEADRLLY